MMDTIGLYGFTGRLGGFSTDTNWSPFPPTVATVTSLLKSYNTLAQASAKSFDGLANASTKSVDGVSNV